ncbi:unnamed protein product [Paramecium sonneborni]|uniref:Uncharacterized protein n=1 Tax=Paramecium sonneborni TaxID=65129 RepID=A0A8S1NLQ3_9CILI|nr:unnamed protein product [Paramecium sonneborni]
MINAFNAMMAFFQMEMLVFHFLKRVYLINNKKKVVFQMKDA